MLAAKSLFGGPFGQRHSRRNGAKRLNFRSHARGRRTDSERKLAEDAVWGEVVSGIRFAETQGKCREFCARVA